MAWLEKKKEEPPAEKQATDIDALIAKLTEAIDAKLSPVNAAIQDVNKRFDSLETAARESAKPPVERREPTSVLDDEGRAFAERLGPLAYQNAVLAARLTESEIIGEMKEQGFGKLIPAVRTMLEQTPIERKAKEDYPAYVRNCMKLAFANEAMTKGVRFNGENDTFYLESGTTPGAETGNRTFDSSMNWVDQKGNVHTADEVAKKLGIEDVAAFAKEFLQ